MATTVRVFRMKQELAKSYRKKRDEMGVNNRTFIDVAITRHLPEIESALLVIGLGDVIEGSFPVKVEIDMKNLTDLSESSQATGIPAIRLLRLCLLRLTAENPKPKGRSGKRKAKTATRKRTTKGGPK